MGVKVKVKVAYGDSAYLEVPESVISHNILRSVGLEPKEDVLIVRLPEHEASKKCGCFSCDLSRQDREVEWFYPYVRFDIMRKNVHLQLNDGDRLLAVRQADLGRWTEPLMRAGFPVGPEDLFRFAAPQSLPAKRSVYLFDEDHSVLNREELLD